MGLGDRLSQSEVRKGADSASGQVLARVADRREATNTRTQLTNKFINESEARIIANGWAKTPKKTLDNAQGIDAKWARLMA